MGKGRARKLMSSFLSSNTSPGVLAHYHRILSLTILFHTHYSAATPLCTSFRTLVVQTLVQYYFDAMVLSLAN